MCLKRDNSLAPVWLVQIGLLALVSGCASPPEAKTNTLWWCMDLRTICDSSLWGWTCVFAVDLFVVLSKYSSHTHLMPAKLNIHMVRLLPYRLKFYLFFRLVISYTRRVRASSSHNANNTGAHGQLWHTSLTTDEICIIYTWIGDRSTTDMAGKLSQTWVEHK